MKFFYGVMCILGVVIPFGAFLPWVYNNGVDLNLMVSQATQSNIATFAWLDVLLSATVLLIFIWSEGARQKVRNLWLPTLSIFIVGVSLALPLFLLMRELQLEQAIAQQQPYTS